jgi:hypothetical protein
MNMRIPFRGSLCVGFLLCTAVLTVPPLAGAHEHGVPVASWLARDGGDVLRPDRGGGAYHWYLGIDAGLTWSQFQNGPLSFYTPNPYNSKYPLQATMDAGNGIGFVIGAALDFPLSENIGLMARVNYHTRTGSSTRSTFPVEAYRFFDDGSVEEVDATIEDKVDLTFSHLSLDVLFRVQLQKDAWYLFFGPSFSGILSNEAALKQRIVEPEDIYYIEEFIDGDDIVNNFRSAESTSELSGFAGGRFDVKFGLGTWIPLSDNLFLTPEISIAWPLMKLVDEAYIHDRIGKPGDTAAVFERTAPFIENNDDFNMMTVFFTVGLRWRIGS